MSCISKIFERIIFKHVYNHLHSQNLFYKYQAGFSPGHSTTYKLLEIYHSIVKSIDEGKGDLSKAFDRVWHKGLIYKLDMYGISGNMLDWFESYLSNRTQKVMYRNIFSSVGHVKAGVPQGSVLGPLLFLLYVNDVAENMILYVDYMLMTTLYNNAQIILMLLNKILIMTSEY